MPVVDQLFLNPFEKWSRYGRFPWTFVLHLLLLILVTVQAAMLFDRDVQHVSRTVRHFVHLFVGSTEEGRLGAQVSLHERKALQEAVSRAVRNNFLINNVSIVHFDLVHPDALTIQVRWRNGTAFPIEIDRDGFVGPNETLEESEAYLRKKVPFLYGNDNLVSEVAMISIDHAFREIGYIPRHRHWVVACAYSWNVKTIFDGRQAGEFIGRVESRASDCQDAHWHPLYIVHVACLGLALVGLVLVLKKFWRSSRMLATLRANTEAWERLTCRDRLMLFSSWWFVAVVMHAVQLVSCSVCLSPYPEIGVRFQSVGFSCFLTWLSMCQYFESFPGYYMAFHTLGISAGRVFRFLCSVGPLFIGFVLLGVCLFWRSRVFQSPGAAAASLFSLMNGDMIHDTFDEVYGIGGLLAHFFLYCFIMLFTYVILNVNISIVTDAYERAKRHPQRENAKLIRQSVREARTSPGNSPPPSPPSSPRLARGGGFGRQPSETTGDEPTRQRSRPLQGYMSPRFFQSERIQEALARAFPEESLLGNDTFGMAEVGGMAAAGAASSSGASGLEASGAHPPTSAGGGRRGSENLEMTSVGRGWEDFDRLFAKLQAAVGELRRLPLPPCDEAAERHLVTRLEELERASSSVAGARSRADAMPRRERPSVVTSPPAFSFEHPQQRHRPMTAAAAAAPQWPEAPQR